MSAEDEDLVTLGIGNRNMLRPCGWQLVTIELFLVPSNLTYSNKS